MNYPKNINGQTYGSSADATSPETEPELISAIGVDGTAGYVLKRLRWRAAKITRGSHCNTEQQIA